MGPQALRPGRVTAHTAMKPLPCGRPPVSSHHHCWCQLPRATVSRSRRRAAQLALPGQSPATAPGLLSQVASRGVNRAAPPLPSPTGAPSSRPHDHDTSSPLIKVSSAAADKSILAPPSWFRSHLLRRSPSGSAPNPPSPPRATTAAPNYFVRCARLDYKM